jgi:TRAP-type C4-dicarboxylate transport system permease small subunit
VPGRPAKEGQISIRQFLDRLYQLSLWLSALCLVAIALLVGVQLAARLLDGALKLAGLKPFGFVILSLAEIAGFLLAASSFFALAATLRSGAHIRVTMLLSGLSESARRWVELWAFGAAAAFSLYMTVNIGRFAYYSWLYHDVSPGLIPVPLAIPQAAMTAGLVILTVALVDEFITILSTGRPTFRAAEEAITLGKEG